MRVLRIERCMLPADCEDHQAEEDDCNKPEQTKSTQNLQEFIMRSIKREVPEFQEIELGRLVAREIEQVG